MNTLKLKAYLVNRIIGYKKKTPSCLCGKMEWKSELVLTLTDIKVDDASVHVLCDTGFYCYRRIRSFLC